MPFPKLKEDATPHPRRWWHIPLLLLLMAGTAYVIRENSSSQSASSANAATQEYVQVQGEAFGTFYHITYRDTSDLQSAIDSVLSSVDYSLSPFNASSVISAVNRNRSMATDDAFREVFRLSQEVSSETEGAFDITVAPLVNIWGFGFEQSESVSGAVIDSLRQFVGYDKVRLKGDSVQKDDPRLMLDCSAVAKGYGVDCVAKYLHSRGIEDYMVEIGGEVRVSGTNPRGESWHIGINKPDDDSLSVSSELEDVLVISGKSMATSGNYRNFYVKNNKKYAHTIDPCTGYPVQHSLLSATVVAPTCAKADAYATSFMVMGVEGAKAVLERHKELSAYFIYTDEKGEQRVWHSENLKLASENETRQ